MKTYLILTVHQKRYKYFKEEATDPKAAMRQLMIRKPAESLIGCEEITDKWEHQIGSKYQTFFDGKYRIVPNTFVPHDVLYHNGEEER